MALNAQKYRDALNRFGAGRVAFVQPEQEFRQWIAERRLPADVAELLLTSCLADELPFPGGRGCMWPAKSIMKLNDRDVVLLNSGLLAIGDTCNGDAIAVDILDPDRRPGYVSHDELWTPNPPQDARTIFSQLCVPLDEMLTRLADSLGRRAEDIPKGQRYPVDFCEAKSGPQSQVSHAIVRRSFARNAWGFGVALAGLIWQRTVGRLRKRRASPPVVPENYVPLYVPSLFVVFSEAERRKGSALTEAEVIALRDSASAIRVAPDLVPFIEPKNQDGVSAEFEIDPDRAWEDWERVRNSNRSKP